MILSEWILKADNTKLEFIKKYDEISPIESITHLSFETIKKTIPNLIDDGKFEEAIALCLSISNKDVLKKTEIERFRLLCWIQRQYEKINEMEKRYLERPPDFKLIAAGIKNLDVLGFTNTIDMLAGGDITKWEEIESLPYEKCFEKQLKTVIENDIQKKLIENNKNTKKK